MADPMVQGLTLTVLGMGLVFSALGALMLTMHLLVRAFPAAPRAETEAPPAPPGGEGQAPETPEEEIAAAVAVALAHLRSPETSRAGLGASLEAGGTAWGQAARARQLRTWSSGG